MFCFERASSSCRVVNPNLPITSILNSPVNSCFQFFHSLCELGMSPGGIDDLRDIITFSKWQENELRPERLENQPKIKPENQNLSVLVNWGKNIKYRGWQPALKMGRFPGGRFSMGYKGLPLR